jgi:signal peptidase II
VTQDAPDEDREAVRRLGIIIALAGGVLVADQVTKSWAVNALADTPIHVIGDFAQFQLTRNSGAAFSSFTGATPLLALMAIGVSVALVRIAARTPETWLVVGLSLVLGGALGNLSDRIFRDPSFLSGHVVDFVDVGRWPVFNVADSAITIGAIVLIVRSLRT